MKMERIQNFITFLLGTALTVTLCLTVRTWAAMFLPLQTAWPIGFATSLLPAYLINKQLTKSYKEIDGDATELGSLFGSLALVNGTLLVIVWLGLMGLPVNVALEDTLTKSYATLGFLDKPLEATLQPYPRSTSGTGVVWVPNIGSNEAPRIIVRQKNGYLRAQYLPPRGKVVQYAEKAVVGSTDGKRQTVMLCPFPKDPANNLTKIRASWDEGYAEFTFSYDRVSAQFFRR